MQNFALKIEKDLKSVYCHLKVFKNRKSVVRAVKMPENVINLSDKNARLIGFYLTGFICSKNGLIN